MPCGFYRRSEKHLKILRRNAKLMNQNFRTGIPLKEETKIKISNANMGNKNGMWKGDKVKYNALHDWIKYHKPKSFFCEKCGKITDKLDLSNISGLYKRDISDFRWLCRSCHVKQDYDSGIRIGKRK